MRIALFGASGKTGTQIVGSADRRGIDVTAYARSPLELDSGGTGHRVVQGELSDADRIAEALVDADAIVIALGQYRPWRRAPVIVDGVRRIVATAVDRGPGRLVYLSALGVADGRADATLVFRALVRPLVLRGVYADHAVDEALIKTSSLDWTIVRPNNLTNAAATGRYRAGAGLPDRFPIGFLSRADLAEAMLDAIDDPATIKSAINIVG